MLCPCDSDPQPSLFSAQQEQSQLDDHAWGVAIRATRLTLTCRVKLLDTHTLSSRPRPANADQASGGGVPGAKTIPCVAPSEASKILTRTYLICMRAKFWPRHYERENEIPPIRYMTDDSSRPLELTVLGPVEKGIESRVETRSPASLADGSHLSGLNSSASSPQMAFALCMRRVARMIDVWAGM